MNRDDVRMVKSARGARFPRKALHAISVGRDLGRQQLDRDFAPEPSVEREMDFAHPTTPELREKLVGADLSLRDKATLRFGRAFDERLGGHRSGRDFDGRRLDEAVARDITGK